MRFDADAEFAHVLHAGRAVVADPARRPVGDEDEEFLGLPGMLSPEQTAALLARRDRRAAPPGRSCRRARRNPPTPRATSWRARGRRCGARSTAWWRVAARTGTPHAAIHDRLRIAVPGPPSASATVDLLARRRDHLLAEL